MKLSDYPVETWCDWRECVDCRSDFTLDSSPHEDRCWQCAEAFDAEAGR